MRASTFVRRAGHSRSHRCGKCEALLRVKTRSSCETKQGISKILHTMLGHNSFPACVMRSDAYFKQEDSINADVCLIFLSGLLRMLQQVSCYSQRHIPARKGSPPAQTDFSTFAHSSGGSPTLHLYWVPVCPRHIASMLVVFSLIPSIFTSCVALWHVNPIRRDGPYNT